MAHLGQSDSRERHRVSEGFIESLRLDGVSDGTIDFLRRVYGYDSPHGRHCWLRLRRHRWQPNTNRSWYTGWIGYRCSECGRTKAAP